MLSRGLLTTYWRKMRQRPQHIPVRINVLKIGVNICRPWMVRGKTPEDSGKTKRFQIYIRQRDGVMPVTRFKKLNMCMR